MRFAFPCLIERDLEELEITGREAYVITFRDIRGANSCGWSWNEALYMAQDCLDVALTFYVDDNTDLPTPSALREGEVMISTTPVVAAKLALYTAMREQRITAESLAKQLNLDEKATKNLLNPLYRTHLTTVQRALTALGRDLIIEDRAVATPPQTVEPL